MQHQPRKEPKDWRTGETPDKEAAPWEHFCTIKQVSAEQAPPQIASPSTVPVLGETAWEEDGTLQWELQSGKQVSVDGFVSVRTEAGVKGRQPQVRQMALVTPVAPHYLASGTELVVTRGAQWWYPYTPIQCNIVKATNMP